MPRVLRRDCLPANAHPPAANHGDPMRRAPEGHLTPKTAVSGTSCQVRSDGSVPQRCCSEFAAEAELFDCL